MSSDLAYLSYNVCEKSSYVVNLYNNAVGDLNLAFRSQFYDVVLCIALTAVATFIFPSITRMI